MRISALYQYKQNHCTKHETPALTVLCINVPLLFGSVFFYPDLTPAAN